MKRENILEKVKKGWRSISRSRSIFAITMALLFFNLCDFKSSAYGFPQFDPVHYAQNNPDVVAAVGNNPGRLFSHYIISGIHENRTPFEGATPGTRVNYEAPTVSNMMNNQNQIFDGNYYAQNNPDVVSVFGSDTQALYQHYISNGMSEKRVPYNGAEPGV